MVIIIITMLISGMHDLFKFKCDKVDTLQFENFTPTDIDTFLTSGQDRVIKTRYSGVNYKSQGFEQSQKRIDDLRTLVKEVNYPIVAADYVANRNYYNVSLAKLGLTDYWFTVSDYIHVKDNLCAKESMRLLKYVTHDRYATTIDNPYRQATLEHPIKLITENFAQIHLGKQINLVNFNISYYMTYLKNPGEITFSNLEYSVLPSHIHEEVVNEAVRSALEYIEQPRQQTFEKEIKTQE